MKVRLCKDQKGLLAAAEGFLLLEVADKHPGTVFQIWLLEFGR